MLQSSDTRFLTVKSTKLVDPLIGQDQNKILAINETNRDDFTPSVSRKQETKNLTRSEVMMLFINELKCSRNALSIADDVQGNFARKGVQLAANQDLKQ